MTAKQELKNRLSDLTDKGFIRYLIQTGYCMREVWEAFIDNDMSESDAIKELEFVIKENIA